MKTRGNKFVRVARGKPGGMEHLSREEIDEFNKQGKYRVVGKAKDKNKT